MSSRPRPGAPAPNRIVLALATCLLLVSAGCSGDDEAATAPTPTGPQQVRLSYTVPPGMTETAVPAATASGGMSYEIKLFTSADDCALRATRMLLPKGDGSEDQDLTYNLVGAVMKESGITAFRTGGHMVPGTPGPVPALTGEGNNSELDLRVLTRVSNGSLQGFQLVYGCPRGQLDEKTWQQLVASVRVDGFQGHLTAH